MIPECPACPFRLWPVQCHASRTGHRRYCDLLAAGRTDYANLIERETLKTQPKPEPPPRVISPQALSARVLIRALADRRNCPSFTRDPGCGCTGECGREGRPLNPSAAECRACLWADNPLHHRDDAENHEHQRPGDTLTGEPA